MSIKFIKVEQSAITAFTTHKGRRGHVTTATTMWPYKRVCHIETRVKCELYIHDQQILIYTQGSYSKQQREPIIKSQMN